MSKLQTLINENEQKPYRKISFSHSNLDDPTQLEALYKQCKEQVLNGTHPVSRSNAIQLAAVQCYIEFGSYKNGIEANVKYKKIYLSFKKIN